MTEASISYDTPYVEPTPAFYSGAAISTLVPHPYPIAIAGHPYQIQWDETAIGVWGARFKQDSLPLLRTQADQSHTPGEQSISPEQFWRRSQESWHYGSGQLHLDRDVSEGSRFYTSKGIDCWTPWKLKLLNTTGSKLTSANSSLFLSVAGSNVYVTDGTALKFAPSPLTSWTTVTGTPNAASSITTDGYTVYTAHGASGVYSTTSGGASTAVLATGTATLVRYVKSRLMVAGGTSLYNYTSGGALPAALLTKATGWTWVDMAAGQSQIYAAGYSGDKSLIYRIQILADATALAAPIIAGELPDGEIIRSIKGYISYVVIGSDLGIRFCSVNSDGSLSIGALIPTTSPVYDSEGQDRFVWYGLTNYDSSSTGLGRMDLTTFTSALTPAYATDLMATGQGTVRSVVTFGNYRLFSVDGLGVFYETASTPVSTGTFTTGLVGYGISDKKVAVFLDLKHEALHGTIAVSIAADSRAARTVGTSTTQLTPSPSYSFPTQQLLGEEFQITVTLTPTSNVSPVLSRWTLRSYPVPVRTAQWNIPILLMNPIIAGGRENSLDVDAEVDFLVGLHRSQKIASLQIGNSNYQAVMYDYQWIPEKVVGNVGSMQGTFYAQFREIAG